MTKRRRNPQAHTEHRSAPRSQIQVEVTLSSDHNLYYGVTADMAEGGLFINTYELFPLGAELELTLTLPEQQALLLRSRVQWMREYSPLNNELPPGIGVQFIDPDPATLNILRQFIAQREPTLYE